MDQPGGQDIAGARSRVPGYTLDGGISVDRAGALVDAHENATGSQVVIRLLSPALTTDAAYRRQVRHDMGVLTALRHQHLLAVIAFDDRSAAIVCEWVQAATLGHVIGVSGPLEPAAALVVFDDCLAALEALHAVGILHRDVHPEAVLVDTGGTSILRDAGVPAPPLRHGWRSGTPQYMAPELWGGRPHTVATDLYATTGILVDSLTGQPPYLGTDLAGLGVQHTHGALPSESVPMIARSLVVRGLAKDPRDRPASAALFRRDVEIAGTAFLGAGWRDHGRALLAAGVAERLNDPAPTLLPVDEFVDEDDGTPLTGLEIDTAADEGRPGGVGWKVWSVAGAAVLALIVMMIFAVQALGGPGVQDSPSAPAAPVITPSTTGSAPTDAEVPTAVDTAGAATASPSPTSSATPTATAPPDTSPVSLAPTLTPSPSASPTHGHHPTPTPSPTT